MVIRNLERDYTVIKKFEGEGDITQFLCQSTENGNDSWHRLARIPLDAVDGHLIAFLLGELKREEFEDLEDYFTDDAYLFVVMRLTDAGTLGENLSQEKVSLRERLWMAHGLIERLVLVAPAPFFFCAAMDEKLIHVSEAGDIMLDYDLAQLCEYGKFSFDSGCGRLGDVLERLFAEEIKLRAFPEMERLVYGLKHGEFGEYLEIHESFNRIFEIWEKKTEADLKPEKVSFRLWEKIKQGVKFLKNLILAGILVLAAVYLVISVRDFLKEPEVHVNYQKIGTLTVRQPETENGEIQE